MESNYNFQKIGFEATEGERFSLRLATLDDIPGIHTLAWKIFPETYKDILSKEQSDYMMEWMYSEENLKKQMTEEGHTYILLFDGNEMAGYVSVQPEQTATEPHIYHLQKIYVLPSLQGHGQGRVLFDAAVKYIQSIDDKECEVHLNVNRHNKALHFYEHLGMTKIDEGDYDIGNGYFMNDYIMSLPIHPEKA